MPQREPIRVEGFTVDEILRHPVGDVAAYISSNVPLIVSVGSSEVLCEFVPHDDLLVIVLAHIDGGGEGILRSIHQLVGTCARQLGFTRLRWVATAVNCASPNLKLRRMLEKLHFQVSQTTDYGQAYVLEEAAT